MAAPLALVVQDPLPLVRIGLRQLVASHRDVEHAGEVEQAEGLPALCELARADVAVFALHEVTPALVSACRAARPGIRLVAMHLGRRADHVEQAAALDLELVSYAAPPDALLGAIEGDGRRAATPLPVERRRHPLRTLSEAERALLRHAAEGRTTHEVAELLGVGVDEVRATTREILALLGVETLAAAVRLGRETGLVPRLRRAG
jgi:DNA-binding NarL/FixJ family response regulator